MSPTFRFVLGMLVKVTFIMFLGVGAIYLLVYLGMKFGFFGIPSGVSPERYYISMVVILSLVMGIVIGVVEVLQTRQIAKRENMTLSEFAALPKEKQDQILSRHGK